MSASQEKPGRGPAQSGALLGVAGAAAFGAVGFASGFLGEYQRFVSVQLLVAALLAASFRGLFRTGVFSLAGPGFMGFGAYAFALGQLEMKVSPLLASGLAVAACFIAACAAGPVVWRVQRIYLALLTMSLVVAMTMIYGELKITGGHGGRYGVKSVAGGVEGWPWFMVCTIASTAVLGALALLEGSRLGRAWRAVGVDAAFAESTGIPSRAHALAAFVLFSTISGFAGVLLAGNNGYVYPQAFGFERIVFMLLAVFVGGVSHFIGPLIGAMFVVLLQEVLSSYEQYTMLILGLSLVTVVLVLPNGLVNLPAAIAATWRRRRSRSGAAAETTNKSVAR
jgi:branched-chain amino acid transport system permease protein